MHPDAVETGWIRPFLASVALGAGVCAFLIWLTYAREAAHAVPRWVESLSHVAAAANAGTAVALWSGLQAARARRLVRHRRLMLTAVGLSAIFFASYVLRHYFVGDTPFHGPPAMRIPYLTVLVAHILGSIFVLITLPLHLYLAATKRWIQHRRLGRWLVPVWLWVSVSGVGIYAVLQTSS